MKKLGVLAALVVLAGCGRREALPILGQVPGFQLTSPAGGVFDRKILDGKIWVADFIFTSCGSSCPMMSAKMRQVQSQASADVKLVSFTVDPEHDTPPVLAEYARRYAAQPGRWYFLTGDRARLNSLSLDTFKLNSVDGSLNHSTRFVLVDRQSRIRGYYGTEDDNGLPRLLRDIRRLERERS
jgi:protein SCO1/2